MVTTQFSHMFLSEPNATLQQGMLWASYHMLAYCHTRSSKKLHLVMHLQKCCQYSDVALETLSDMTNQAGLQCGLIASGIML